MSKQQKLLTFWNKFHFLFRIDFNVLIIKLKHVGKVRSFNQIPCEFIEVENTTLYPKSPNASVIFSVMNIS